MQTIELCSSCNGIGKKQIPDISSSDIRAWVFGECTNCKGTGKMIEYTLSTLYPFSEEIMPKLTELDTILHKSIRTFNDGL